MINLNTYTQKLRGIKVEDRTTLQINQLNLLEIIRVEYITFFSNTGKNLSRDFERLRIVGLIPYELEEKESEEDYQAIIASISG